MSLTPTRQDMVDQMQAELVKCATELGKRCRRRATGAQYVAISGDGAAAFFAALEPVKLAKACP
ncbi:MAG: hypothetical protein IPQ07_44210 [Myxococcales bacterium]|nr:hypothetical protein [Myxococcales bacterium]